MKIGIVGYRGSGKTTLFEWLTGAQPDLAHAHLTQTAMASVPDSRLHSLSEIYKPKKITEAALEMVDTPRLSRTHEGSAAKLAMIREAGCLVIVLASHEGSDAVADLSNFDDDMLIADVDVVSGRIERLREQITKPRPNRDELRKELEALEPLLAVLESGQPMREADLSPDQSKAIRSFQLFSEKPRLVIVNIADDDSEPERFQQQMPAGTHVATVSLDLQMELSRMEEDERDEFCREMGVGVFDRDSLLQRIMDVSGQMLFFTVGPKEVHAWMISKGATAQEAAGCIHTDLARGFIRAEVMTCEALLRLGSEREVKAHNLMRKEHKEYVVQEDDILLIQHN
ncbi:MAG: redox-regulated ATPase YchF [Planctomycetes bacterium]|nr:redox-regulated ATPase YchF [Planctomycetota bacterium]MBL7044819.1 redox-regulated ATPase YchF [Pirellulaceae bacterium]